MAEPGSNRRLVLTCVFLIAMVVACFSPLTPCGFVNYDDPEYFYDNPHVLTGLTAGNVAWAFRTEQLASRYPLTWISYMLDATLFGDGPAGPHTTNLLLHAANTVLVFLLLRRWTGSFWQSFAVAALFGLHPLRVEAVAWISERKGVLCAFFSLIALWFYTRSVEGGKSGPEGSLPLRFKSGHYWLAVLFFAFALMAKPVAVTLPCVLLLLDYWPLSRVSFSTGGFPVRALIRLTIEKIPYFALTLAGSAVTMLTHRHAGAIVAVEEHSLLARVKTALVAFGWYLEKTFWPTNLALPYPYPKVLPWQQVTLAAIVGIVLCLLALWWGRKRPYLPAGWFWFLGTLVPVIGLVRWGHQAYSDRFSYFPSIGLFILLVWGVTEVLARWRIPERALSIALGVILAACFLRSLNQMQYWQSSETLFRHAAAVTKDNYVAYFNLGGALDDTGRTDEAMPLFREAVRLAPRDPEAQFNLGTGLMKKGELDEAKIHFALALTNRPGFARAYVNLGNIALNQGQTNQALSHYEKAIQLDPDDHYAHYNLGSVWLSQAKLNEAVKELTESVRLRSSSGDAHANLAVALARLGHPAEAMPHFIEAARRNSDKSGAHLNLGLALMEQGRIAEAEAQFGEALRLQPDDAQAHYRLAQALRGQRKTAEAIAQFREAMRLQPDNPAILGELALVLSTASDAKLRAGDEAVRLAQRACELTSYEQTAMLTTLAAAQAETGKYTEAVVTAEKAIALPQTTSETEVAVRARTLRDLFRSGRPFRENY